MQVSVRDVANDAGVSVGTVSNVLNHPAKVAAATVERVQQSIEKLGFVRNDAARQLRAGRSRTIGLVVLDSRNPFFTELARGAEERAIENGLSVLLANSDEKQARENTHLALFEEQRVTGLLVTPVGSDLKRLHALRDRGIPVVLMDRQSDDDAFPSVAVDDVEGGRIAAQHLLDIGRRQLAFVGGPVTLRQVADRLEGAQNTTLEAKAALEFIGTSALTVDEGRRVGLQIIDRSPEHRPDAIFAANDLIALGILQSFVMEGSVRIPEDIALVGYDDIDFSAAAAIPLTSVRQPAALIGATAVDLLLQDPEEDDTSPNHVIYQPELVVRASTVRER
ncbi:LacI family DNA-binding transcriptional regulator [Gulosibacter chungangensis]|uniref:LacI family transcriptional regulator n=1 Tax=Gulosibacter chungangensis TaxID=979746 RepID=A0A7J5B9M0_9MICO|nr:LacI family DNA-binding transcriptional regulator [Gulosibacter chungangensis]KAB1641725.1 LacI family transcriptional regulator [Gulosibacter chungangensis]